jgi:predicted transcriptional regulator
MAGKTQGIGLAAGEAIGGQQTLMKSVGNYLVWLGGGDRAVLAEVPLARPRFIQMAGVLLTVAGVAGASMIFAVHDGLNEPWPLSAALAVPWGLMILFAERFLVLSTGASRYRGRRLLLIAIPRLALAVILAFVIATPLVLRVFASEIKAQINATQAERLRHQAVLLIEQIAADEALLSGHLPRDITSPQLQTAQAQVASLQQQAVAVYQSETAAFKAWQCQLYGTSCKGAVGIAGSGPLAQAKEQQYRHAVSLASSINAELAVAEAAQSAAEANLARTQTAAIDQAQHQARVALPQLQAKYSALTATLQKKSAAAANPNRADGGILAQIQALSELSQHDFALRLAQLTIFLLFSLIEILPVVVWILLSLGPKSAYEVVAESQELEIIERARTRLIETNADQSDARTGNALTSRLGPSSEYLIDEYRRLAEHDPMLRRDLAASLNNLGVRYAALGRVAQSLEASQEAVTFYRDLAASNPTFLPDLAGSLSNLGTRYAEVGRISEALEATQEAIAHYRSRPTDEPAFRSSLAASLNNLGVRYAALGRAADALEATQEAVSHYRDLAAGNPTFLPDLAGSLSNLGALYDDLGRSADALAATQEAVTHYRELATSNPAFAPRLAYSLNSLGVRYADLGRAADALEATQEAVSHYRDLVAGNPMFLPDLAGSLSNLGALYDDLGRSADALAATQEAITLFRELGAVNPAYRGRLAAAATNLAAAFQSRYRSTGNADDLEQAVELLQQALATTPAEYPDRPALLSNLAAAFQSRYRSTGNADDLEQAVELLQQALATTPAEYPDRPALLSNLAAAFQSRYRSTGNADDLEQALKLQEQAVAATPVDHPDRPAMISKLAALGSPGSA